MISRTLCFISIVCALACAIFADESQPQSPAKKIELFNGKNLDGFYTWLVDSKREDPRGVYSVKDGAIRISGDGFGYIATKDTYKDYHLIAEFKWGERNYRGRETKARDSGIFLHASGSDGNSYDGNGAFMCAIECNVMEGAVGDFLLIKGRDSVNKPLPLRVSAAAKTERDAEGWLTWKAGGKTATLNNGGRVNWFNKSSEWKDVLDFRGKNDIEKPAGKWNRVECVCDGSKIQIFLNGTQVNEVIDVQPNFGRILLQCEGSEIFFRKLELHPLEKKR